MVREKVITNTEISDGENVLPRKMSNGRRRRREYLESRFDVRNGIVVSGAGCTLKRHTALFRVERI